MSTAPTLLTWLDPPQNPTGLFVLISDSFWVALSFISDMTPLRDRLDKGEPPLEVLGKSALRIPLDSLSWIECDKRRSDLVLVWTETAPDGKVSQRTKTYGVRTQSIRDAIFETLVGRLGSNWQTATREPGPFQMSAGSIVLTVAGLVLTWLAMHLFRWLQGIELSAQPSGNLRGTIGRWIFRFLIQPILQWLGSAGGDYVFLGLGVLIVFLGALMIVSQIRNPSLFVKLEPRLPSAD